MQCQTTVNGVNLRYQLHINSLKIIYLANVNSAYLQYQLHINSLKIIYQANVNSAYLQYQFAHKQFEHNTHISG
jgi:hypothetical protein